MFQTAKVAVFNLVFHFGSYSHLEQVLLSVQVVIHF